jgi:hypothetical protein
MVENPASSRGGDLVHDRGSGKRGAHDPPKGEQRNDHDQAHDNPEKNAGKRYVFDSLIERAAECLGVNRHFPAPFLSPAELGQLSRASSPVAHLEGGNRDQDQEQGACDGGGVAHVEAFKSVFVDVPVDHA